MSKTWRTWTAKEVARLETLRLEGLTPEQIAPAMGRTVASIRNRLRQESIQARPRHVRTRLRWLDAFRQPHTIRGLAERFGVTVWAVKQAKRKLRRAGFEVPAANRKGVIC